MATKKFIMGIPRAALMDMLMWFPCFSSLNNLLHSSAIKFWYFWNYQQNIFKHVWCELSNAIANQVKVRNFRGKVILQKKKKRKKISCVKTSSKLINLFMHVWVMHNSYYLYWQSTRLENWWGKLANMNLWLFLNFDSSWSIVFYNVMV